MRKRTNCTVINHHTPKLTKFKATFLNFPNDQEVAEQPIVVRKNQRNFVQKKVYHSRD